MMRFFLMILFMACAAVTAEAGIKYYPDPVYEKLNDEDQAPMADIIDMAQKGDVRAQFIMGDLYSKGKGGLPKDESLARHWFEEAAMHGYDHSFIRLAAMAKRENKPIEAWQWYSLAIKAMDYGDKRKYVVDARHDLAESAHLTQADFNQARKAMNEWEDMRDKKLYDEKKAVQEQQRKEKTSIAGANANEQDQSQNTNR